MSKHIKQMQMDALRQTFAGVRDLVFLTASGLSAQADNQMRAALRKKSIRVQVVKNSLARRVFDDLGVRLEAAWASPTLVAWGAGSLAELSRELDAVTKKNDKVKVKAAVSEGQELSFGRALTMPTRAEAIARVVALALAPAQRLVAQALAPAARVAGQVRVLGERSGESAAPATS